MQKLHEIVVAGVHRSNCPDGVYQVNIFRGENLYRTCVKVLYGNTPEGKYRYALFRNDYGYVIRRKVRYISEQEQNWEDVAEVVRIL